MRCAKLASSLSLIIICGLLGPSVATMAQSAAPGKHTLSLSSGWEFSQRGDHVEKWLPAEVPGDIHLDLLRNRLIPDPYYRDDESKLQWIEDVGWSYRTVFNVNAETLQSAHVVPELSTIQSFTTPEDRDSIFTPLMLAHQKNNEGNSIIHDYLLRDYDERKDFQSFLYVSQVLQTEGVKVGAEHMRRSRPRIMGSLFWQLNDCWPVASRSSIDYFGKWKALQYYARRFYNPLLVSPTLLGGNVDIYAVSDNQQQTAASLRIRVMSMDGTIVKQEKQDIVMPSLSSQQYMHWPLLSILQRHQDLSDLFLTADLTRDGKLVSRNILYLQPTKLVHLIPTDIRSTLAKDGNFYRLTLTSCVSARDVYVTFGKKSVALSDNYVDLLPGEPITIAINSTEDLASLSQELKVVSLADAFAPAKYTSKQ